MRGLKTFIVGVLSAAIIVALAIFAVQNLQGITAHFIGATFTPSVWWVSIGSAALGFILALLLLAPGRIATGWRARALDRDRLRRDQELSVLRQEHDSLRTQHAHLQAEREGLQTERDQLRARLAAANSVPMAGTATAARRDGTTSSQPATAATTTTTSAVDTTGASYPGEVEPYTTTAQPDVRQTPTQVQAERETRTDTAIPATSQQQHEQLGVGERLRGIFSRPREDTVPEERSWNNDQPPVPTA